MFETDLDSLIAELRTALKGRSNIINKDEIRFILDGYEKKKNQVPKDFWNPNPNNEKGLITNLIDNFKFRNQFTKEEWEEMDKIRKESYLKTMRELAKEEGKERAKREFKSKR